MNYPHPIALPWVGSSHGLIAQGFWVFTIVLASAIVGTLVYGAVRHILPR